MSRYNQINIEHFANLVKELKIEEALLIIKGGKHE